MQLAASARNAFKLSGHTLSIGTHFFLAIWRGFGQIRGMAPPDVDTPGTDERIRRLASCRMRGTSCRREERVEGFRLLPRADAEELFFTLAARDQYDLIMGLPPGDRRSWLRLLPPDDAADVIQEAPEDERAGLMALLDEQTRKEVTALLAYAEDDAGGLMNPRYVRVRPDMTVDEAISYLRKQARERIETLAYAYVARRAAEAARRRSRSAICSPRSRASWCAT